MPDALIIRELAASDFAAWQPLWRGYNEFYGRVGDASLPDAVTQTTWKRFFDPGEPVFALAAIAEGELVGLTHYLFHRSTTRIEPICYLQDLFTLPEKRGRGIGRALILAVYERAKAHGAKRVYWQTHETNAAGRMLYDKVAKHFGFLVYAYDL